jgi:hypothetical protein
MLQHLMYMNSSNSLMICFNCLQHEHNDIIKNRDSVAKTQQAKALMHLPQHESKEQQHHSAAIAIQWKTFPLPHGILLYL